MIPIDVLSRYVLSPILIWQGYKLRRTALVLPEAEGARNGREGTGPTLRLLIVGDSSAAGVGVTHQSQALAGQLVSMLAQTHDVHWKLIARTGRTTAQTLDVLDRETTWSCDAALIALGVNDVTRFVPVRRFRRQHVRLRDTLRRKFGASQLIITQVPPMQKFPALSPLLKWILGAQAARFAQALDADLACEPDARLLTFDMPFEPDLMAKDGFHPSARTYRIWAGEALCQLEL